MGNSVSSTISFGIDDIDGMWMFNTTLARPGLQTSDSQLIIRGEVKHQSEGPLSTPADSPSSSTVAPVNSSFVTQDGLNRSLSCVYTDDFSFSKREEAADTSSSEVSQETAGTTNLEVSTDAKRIGQISFDLSKDIGITGNETAVYEGSYDRERLAVKSIPKSHVGRADQERENQIREEVERQSEGPLSTPRDSPSRSTIAPVSPSLLLISSLVVARQCFPQRTLKKGEETAGTSSSDFLSETAGTTSPEVSPEADKSERRIGELSYNKSKIIATSSNGTAVFEGSYKGRPVAVKRIPQRQAQRAHREIRNFVSFEEHKNIVKYYGMESNEHFVCLVLELCDYNLHDLIQMSSAASSHQHKPLSSDFDSSTRYENPCKLEDVNHLKKPKNIFKLWKENNGRPTPLLQKLMWDMVSGLVHLHKSHMVHRDLKPQNVLIIEESSTLSAKLSDLGTSRLLDGKSSLNDHFLSYGTMGWKAKKAHPDGHQTDAMDLFSLGCLLFYCITCGRHPFGEDRYERDTNISEDNVTNLFLIKDFPEACHLISLLLKADQELRPKAIEVLHHPLFWDAKKRLSFLSHTSDRARENLNFFKALKSTAATTLGAEMALQENVVRRWNKKVDCEIISHMLPYAEGNYDYSSVQDLLRLIQNIFDLYAELLKDQLNVGPLYEVLDDYFTSRFPMLLIEVYKVVCTYCKEDEHFKTYFKTYFEGHQ